MFKKLECVCLYTEDIERSLTFYTSMGLEKSWMIERTIEGGFNWILVGLKFPQKDSSELVLSNHPENKFTEVEILVDDVRKVYSELSNNKEIQWIRAPFTTESGHVAVMEAPDNNVFVLVGK